MNSPFDNEKPYEWLWHCMKILSGPTLDRDNCAIYLRSIGCNDSKTVCKAFATWLRTERQFPAPADIRDLIEKEAASDRSKSELTKL